MAEQSLKDKTAKGLFWGGVSNGVQQLLNLTFGLILARILNAEDYGMVGMLAIFSAVASTIQESGFTAALTNQKEIRNEDYNAVFWFSSLTGLFFYSFLFFSAPLIAHFYNRPELIGLSRIVFLGFLFGGLGISSNAYLFKKLMVKERAVIDVVALLCSGIVGVVLALNGFAYYGLAIQSVTYIGVGSFLKLYYAPWHPSFQFSIAPLRLMFGFGSKLILTNIFTQVNNNMFSVILGKFYDARQLGLYSQGEKWMGMGNLLIGGMINGVAQPVLVEISDDIDRKRNVFRKMVRFGAFISLPAMLGLAFVAREFIQILLGEKWLPSVPFLQLFCIWGAARYLFLLYTNLLISQGRSNLYLYGMIFTGVLQLIVVLAMFSFGIYPMVVAYILVFYVGLIYWHICVSRYIPISLVDIIKDVLPYLCAILMALASAYILTVWIENIYVLFFSKIFIVAMVYICIMWLGNSVIFRESVAYLRK
ncbi:lipopolysaccharide biosynthesis protein [Parabacteroides sp.]|uniref:lipopolysaccharide biosynthesis protein n=1 Tax=Parabacteroides sp. TaxID=1869337 RepID=UPI0026DF3483|nr:lipopolysaccharide biosynthesis protein [Parabacteroides sp.]MDO5429825.1 lipopolysaccharide biosynthesis protein [Parabacteroides sp.]